MDPNRPRSREAVANGRKASAVDIEASGLLDGLDRVDREAELIEWLLGGGLSVEQIRGEFAPMLLPAGRIMGDDGVYVSAREICAETGIDLELLGAMQRAFGLPQVDDPDAQVHLRAHSEAAARARVFVDCWLPNRRAMQSVPPTALPGRLPAAST